MGRRPLPKWISPFVIWLLIHLTLWGISNPFGLVSPSSGQVTNALLTRSPLKSLKRIRKISVRLACIRHAASVHPEPGSNSPHINFFIFFRCFSLGFTKKLTRFLSSSYHSSVVKVPVLFCIGSKILNPLSLVVKAMWSNLFCSHFTQQGSMKPPKTSTAQKCRKKVSWQRPTLPRGRPPSTIGADDLNFRVRDVTGCTLVAPITKRLTFTYSVFITP